MNQAEKDKINKIMNMAISNICNDQIVKRNEINEKLWKKISEIEEKLKRIIIKINNKIAFADTGDEIRYYRSRKENVYRIYYAMKSKLHLQKINDINDLELKYTSIKENLEQIRFDALEFKTLVCAIEFIKTSITDDTEE